MAIQLLVERDNEAMSRRAVKIIVERLRENPALLICAASGATPTRTYQLLAKRCKASPDLFAKVRLIKLDEWHGLEMDDPASCEVYLQQHLVRPMGISPDRYISFQSNSADPQDECRRIAETLEQEGPIDLAIVGLGVNGHIGFNEPGDRLQSHAHVAMLADQTRCHPMLDHAEAVDARDRIRFGLTLGMTDILQARRVLLLASGSHKVQPLQRMLHSRHADPGFPASHLRNSDSVTYLCDQVAMP